MIDIRLTEAHEALRRRAREIRDTQVLPFIATRGWDRPLSRQDWQSLYRLLLPLGYPGTPIPREAGGAGLDHLSLGIIVEEMAPALGFVSPHVVTRQVAMLGTDELKRRRYLPALLNVDRLGAAAISEPFYLSILRRLLESL